MFDGKLMIKSITSKEKILHFNQWISLREIKDLENDINGYVFSHEERCNGKIVSILPFRFNGREIEYLLRNEVTPCWDLTESQISSITGGVEEDDIFNTALMELHEEAGFQIEKDKLIYLGTCKGIKSSDTNYYLFSANLTNEIKGEAIGDGSELENKANCFWTKNIDESVDPLVYVVKYKLDKYLRGN